MERESNQTQQPNPCRNGCGFYGSAATEGMCSQCYKSYVKRRQNSPITPGNPATATAAPMANSSSNSNLSASVMAVAGGGSAEVTPKTSASSTDLASGGEAAGQGAGATASPKPPPSEEVDSASVSMEDSGLEDSLDEKKTPKKRNRCFTCRKKVGLTGFECRCGGVYCSLHRYSDKHDCTFDYKTDGQEQIRKNNPLVVGEKIQKI